MDVVAYLPADAQAAEPVQVGERTLYETALGAQAGAVLGAVTGDQRFHAQVPDQSAVLVVVVASVAQHHLRTAPGPAALAPHRRHCLKQRAHNSSSTSHGFGRATPHPRIISPGLIQPLRRSFREEFSEQSNWRKPLLLWIAGVLAASLAGFGTNTLTGWWQALFGGSSSAETRPSSTSVLPNPLDAPIRHQGPLILGANQYADLDSLAADWHRTSGDDRHADIWFDHDKMNLTGDGDNEGSSLSVLPAGNAGDHEACATMSAPYGHPLEASEMTVGQAVCVVTGEHHIALLRITAVQDGSSGKPDELAFHVIVYTPPHTD